MLLKFVAINLLVFGVNAFNVLILSSNVGYSHLGYSGAMADALVDAGHTVDFVIPMWNHFDYSNGTRKATIRRFDHKHVEEIEALMRKTALWGDAFESIMGDKDQEIFATMYGLLCDAYLSDPEFIPSLRAKHYAVGLAESLDYCSMALLKMLNVPSIHQMVAFPTMDFVDNDLGTTIDFNHVPASAHQAPWREQPTMVDRLTNMYDYMKSIYKHAPLQRGIVESTYRKYGVDIPSMDEIYRTTAYSWLNSFEEVDIPRPRAPKAKHVGGIAVRKSGPLDKDLQEIYNRSESVVLVSFGSIVDTTHMKVARRDIILSLFSQFPHLTFIWKVTRLEPELVAAARRIAPNARLVRWIQQSSVLAHPKTVAFITHMGLNSLNEAAVAGVPMVGVPFFGDQQLNSAMAVRRGIARFVDRRSLSVESLREALAAVLTDPKYREASNDVKQKIKAAPFSPKDVFVKTVEFAAKFGNLPELNLPVDPLYRRLQLDLIAAALIIFTFMLISLFSTFRFISIIFRSLTSQFSQRNLTENVKKLQ